MRTPHMLTTFEELVGKTIAKLVIEDDSTVYLLFTDGTLGGFSARYHYEDLEIEMADVPYDETQLKLGLIDDDELKRRKSEQSRASEENRMAQNRAEYERLKKMFEPPQPF